MTILSAAILLFFIMDPFGNMVIFNNILNKLPEKRRSIILFRESIIAYVIMLFFLFFGQNILNYLQVETPALGIGGGIILFLVALGMVFPSRSITTTKDDDSLQEPFIVPIAIPFMAGPSLIASLLLLVSHYPDKLLSCFIAVTIASIITMLILVVSPKLLGLLKPRGVKAIERLMGLILIIISVQMLLNGIRDYLQTL